MKRKNWRLSTEQKLDARDAFELAEGSGFSLLELVKIALEDKKNWHSKISALECVDRYIRHCRQKGLRQPTVDTYEINLRLFAEDFGEDRMIAGLNRSNLNEYVRTAARMRSVKAMLNYGVKQEPRWLPENPLINFELSLPRAKSRRSQIGYLPLAEVQQVFDSINPDKAPGYALAFFAMIRPQELHSPHGKPPIAWEQINFDNRTVFIRGDQSKVDGAERLLEGLPDNLWAWLDAYKPEVIKPGTPVFPFVSSQIRRHVKRMFGYGKSKPWPHDAIRDTAITNHVVAFENTGKTAMLAGHEGNPSMIFNHYFARGLTKADALEYWEIKPK